MVRDRRTHTATFALPSPIFLLLCGLLALLWLTGGASRGDVAGQFLARGAAWVALVGAALFAPRGAALRFGPVAWLLVGAIALPLLQLVPLPPGVWEGLPGRASLAEGLSATGIAPGWRPLSIVPGATANAAASLVVPAAVLVLLGGLSERERDWLPGILLGFVLAGVLVGLLQFSGARFDNPLVNDTVGQVSGTFANRNHFALLVAIGCALLPTWVFGSGRRAGWRVPAGVGTLALFVLTILATGSRAGLGLGLAGVAGGLMLVRSSLVRELRRYPRWVGYVLLGVSVLFIAILIFVSIAADRAVSIDRVLLVDADRDIRTRALPTMLVMVERYFPVGTGLGSFDPLFRMHEPFALLKPTYFNHAHNDYLEVVLDAGLVGALLLAATLLWATVAGIKAWVPRFAGRLDREERARRRLGAVVLALIAVASVVDYPARTPIVMAVAIIAATWLSGLRRGGGSSPLPDRDRSL